MDLDLSLIWFVAILPTTHTSTNSNYTGRSRLFLANPLTHTTLATYSLPIQLNPVWTRIPHGPPFLPLRPLGSFFFFFSILRCWNRYSVLSSVNRAADKLRSVASQTPSASEAARLWTARFLRDCGSRRNLVGGMSAKADNGKGEARQTGLEGTRLPLPGDSYSSVYCASSDPQLRQMLDCLKFSKSPAVVNYGASWCGVCSQILPPFCKFSNEFKNLTFIYAHVDECPQTTQNIRYTPTFHFYRDGERVDEMFGAGEERLHDRLWLHS